MTTTERSRNWRGPALFSFGFRPFFLMAGIWAAIAMALWIAMLSGHAPLPTAFDPFSWHAHEFVFGYVSAVLTGFLLTAVPNWTGRLPVAGWPLAGLAGLWLLGRLAVAMSSWIDPLAVALADGAELAVLALFLAGAILAGRNWRNLPVLLLVTLFLSANMLFHWQVIHDGAGYDGAALRLGLAGAIMMMVLIGGRIVPSFTRNWLVQRRSTRLPTPAGRADTVIVVLTAVACLGFVIRPEGGMTAALAATAGLANLWRLSRWQGWQTAAEPLVWVLHVGYLCIGTGFLSVAGAAAGLWPRAGALHLWLAGAIGLMTLAVMTRASLGHSGRALHAGPGIAGIYVAVIVSVLARLAAIAWTGQPWLLDLAGTAWILGFGGFAVIYAPILAMPAPGRKTPSRAPA